MAFPRREIHPLHHGISLVRRATLNFHALHSSLPTVRRVSPIFPTAPWTTLHLTPLKRTLRQRSHRRSLLRCAPIYVVVPITEISPSLFISLSLSVSPSSHHYFATIPVPAAASKENNLCYARNGKRSDDFSTSMLSPVQLRFLRGAPGEPSDLIDGQVRYGFPVRRPVHGRKLR